MADDQGAVTAPGYMAAFRCVGGACEETCCSSFHVDIDRTTFRSYMGVQAPGLGDDLRRHVTKLRDPRTEARYGRISLTAQGLCPFLEPDRLCAIQKQLGEGALSETCRSYPRETWQDGGRRYLGAKLSCPEVARLCVSSPEAMDVAGGDAVAEGDLGARSAVRREIDAAVRDPATPVWKALLFAGVIAETFLTDGLTDAPAGADALQAIRDYAADTRAALAAEDFALGDQALMQLKTLSGIALSASAKCSAHNRFPGLAKAALDRIIGAADNYEGAVARYGALYATRFAPFDAAHDHALRNAVLNYLHVTRAFLTGPILPQVQNLAVRFGVWRLLLVGLSDTRPEGLTLDDYAAVVSAASRIMDHDATVSPEICATLDALEPRSVSLAVRMVIPPV